MSTTTQQIELANRLKKLSQLNVIYNKILKRDADPSGIATYIKELDRPNGHIYIENQLLSSEEYLKIINAENFNSLTGDRVAYIKSDDLSIIDNSPYKELLTNLIELIIKIDNDSYTKDQLIARINTVKKSLIHIGTNNLPFTIFPHLEYCFNTDKFNESIKNIKNLQYYIIYMTISNIWKTLFNKQVNTCGTKTFVESLNPKLKTFKELIDSVQDFFISYFSIRIVGRLLSVQEKDIAYNYVKENESQKFINYLSDLTSIDKNEEEQKIAKTFSKFNKKPSVLVMIAYLETQNPYFLNTMLYHCEKLKEVNRNLNIDFALDNDRVGKEPTDYTPWSRVKRIRNMMIEKYPISNYDYLYIIDSDMIDYPHNFLTRAIGLNPEGITAPVALIQNSIVFYDWCGFQKKGNTSLYGPYGKYIKNLSVQERNFNLTPPYVDDNSRLVEIDCVGCTYVVPSKVFSLSYGDMKNELIDTFNIAGVTNHKVNEDKVQYEDHPCFTDHFTVCAALRANGGKVFMDRGSIAYHADLPIYGEAWH